MQHIHARHNAETAARVDPAPIEKIALQRQCAGGQRGNICENAEEGHAPRVSKGNLRAPFPKQDIANKRLSPLKGKASEQQRNNSCRRNLLQILYDVGQSIAKHSIQNAEKEDER